MELLRPTIPKSLMFGIPNWFHVHGHKIRAIGINSANSPTNKTLLLESKSVRVNLSSDSQREGWNVLYQIKHEISWTNGFIHLSNNELKVAFDLPDAVGSPAYQEILDLYGGDAAVQGKFIRYKQHLNIPGPGTGMDGDPNVSILIDSSMQAYLRLLLG